MNINKNILISLSHLRGEAIWLYASRFSSVLLQSVILLIIAAVVGAEEFGQFSFIFSAARIIAVVLGVGGPLYLQRELALHDVKYAGAGNLNIFIKVLMRMNALSLIFLILFYILITVFNFEYDILLMLLTGYLLSFFDILIAVIRVAKTASYSMVLRDSFPYLFFLVGFVIAIVIDDLTAKVFILIFCASLIICIFIAIFTSFGYLYKRRAKFEQAINQNFFYSFWGTAIIGTSFAQSDVIIAKYFLSELELGAYAVLRRMTNLISLPQVIVNWSINIDVVKFFATENKSKLQDLALKGLFIAIPVSLIILIFMLLLSSIWLDLFDVTMSYSVYVVFVVLSMAQLVNVMSGANLLFALQCHEEKYVVKVRFISLIIGVALMVMGGYLYGMIGLALGATTSIFLLNMMVTNHVKNKIGIWTSVPFLRFGC